MTIEMGAVVIGSTGGIGAALVRALVADGVRGLVVAGTGNGSLHHALEGALLQVNAAISTGNGLSFLVGRISYSLGLTGSGPHRPKYDP